MDPVIVEQSVWLFAFHKLLHPTDIKIKMEHKYFRHNAEKNHRERDESAENKGTDRERTTQPESGRQNRKKTDSRQRLEENRNKQALHLEEKNKECARDTKFVCRAPTFYRCSFSSNIPARIEVKYWKKRRGKGIKHTHKKETLKHTYSKCIHFQVPILLLRCLCLFSIRYYYIFCSLSSFFFIFLPVRLFFHLLVCFCIFSLFSFSLPLFPFLSPVLSPITEILSQQKWREISSKMCTSNENGNVPCE